MMKRTGKNLVLLLATALVLTACSQTKPADPEPEAVTPTDGAVRFSVAFTSDENNGGTDTLNAMGIPYDPTSGDTGIDTVRIKITDRDGNPVTFELENDVYVARKDGAVPAIELGSLDWSADLELPDVGNPYSFESIGSTNTPNAIGYEIQSQRVDDNDTVNIKLRGVLGEATLKPRFPTTKALPGTVLDLMLTVTANDESGLHVPLDDFTANYGTVDGASVVSESNRGIRVEVDDACSNVEIQNGTVTGLLEKTPDEFDESDVEIDGSHGYSIECVQANDGSITIDDEAPEITITSYDSVTGEVTGKAKDNVGVAKVQLFDGTQLVASTQPDEIAGGAARIEFNDPDDSTVFTAWLKHPRPDSIQGVVTDTSGNEGRSAETQNRMFLYVRVGGDDSNPGTEAEPLATLQAALNIVEPGGTVYVADGTYLPDDRITINTAGVTLRGESEHDTVIDLDDSNHSYGLDVRADEVVIETLTVTNGSGNTFKVGTGSVLDGFTMTNVTVRDSALTGVDLNGVTNVTLTGVTVENTSDGVGISMTAADGVTLDGVSTDGNAWGGVGIYIDAQDEAVSNVYITRSSTFSEDVPVYAETQDQSSSGSAEFSNFNFEGFEYAVYNPGEMTNNNHGIYFDYYFKDFDDAAAYAFYLEDEKNKDQSDRSTIQATDSADTSERGSDWYVTEDLSIQAAVDRASEGDTVNLAGTHTLSNPINITTDSLLLKGATDAKLKVTSNSGVIIKDSAAGVKVSDLSIEMSAPASYAVELKGSALQNVEIAHVDITGYEGSGGEYQGIGVKVESKADASGFTMTDVAIKNVHTGLAVPGGTANNPTVFKNVNLQGVTISNAADKGIYVEALSNAVFENLTITDSGNVGNSAGKNGAGVSINITHGPSANIVIRNSEIMDSGASPQGGGAALTLKSAPGVDFNGISIEKSTITNRSTDVDASGVALRVGEPDPNANNPGPKIVSVTGGKLDGGNYYLLNDTANKVTLDNVDTQGHVQNP